MSQRSSVQDSDTRSKKGLQKCLTNKVKYSDGESNKKGGSNVPILQSGVTKEGIQWQKTGAPGNASLDTFLSNEQSIQADQHAMAFMDAAMELRVEAGNLKKAVGRMFSGESIFMSFYTGKDPKKKQRVSFGTPLVGDIRVIEIKSGETWVLSRGAFLAGTTNLQLSGKLNPKGLFSFGQQEGLVLQTVTTKEGTGPGTMWMASYGNIEEHVLKSDDALIIDNEHFLATEGNSSYDVVKVGNMKAAIFGGEGLAMRVKGPCVIYTQNKGVIAMVREIMKYAPARGNSRSSTGALLGVLAANAVMNN